ncbi:MAG: prepilin-type N-terminal cleavage/methylation domain-containing protein [bacterium]
MINLNKKKNKKNSGFTLVETLVALFIFSISIITTMSVLSGGVSNTMYAKNKVIAEYLAQEGIEYFKNIRDTSMLYDDDAQAGWTNFKIKLTNSGCAEQNGCYFNNNETSFPDIGGGNWVSGIDFQQCVTNICPNFSYNTVTGQYTSTGTQNSVFSRKMKVEFTTGGDGLKVISEVTFITGTKSSTVSFSENLSNWIE